MEHDEEIGESPAVRAAVALERRFATIDKSLSLILQTLQTVQATVGGLQNQVTIANGRTAKNEDAIKNAANALAGLSDLVRGDRGVLHRLDEAEENIGALNRHGLFADGGDSVRAEVSSRDKWIFGIFIGVTIAAVQIAITLLSG